jgi:hypothetical protein
MPDASAVSEHASAPASAAQHYAELDLANLPDADGYYVIEDAKPGRRLHGLNRVNLLIGPNNAGKSRFLRALFKAPKFRHRPSGIDRRRIIEAVKKLDEHVRTALTGSLIGFGPLRDKNELTKFTVLDWFLEGENPLGELRKLLTDFIELTNFNSTYSGMRPPESQVQQVHATLLPFARELLSVIGDISLVVGSEPRVYVPVLRGLRPFGSDVYAERTRRDYQFEQVPGSVFTGLTLYEHLRDLLLGSRAERQSVREYEEFLGQELFDGSAVELIPRREGDVVYFRIGADEERPIYALGDGFQALIAITFPPFTAAQRTLFFIEELDSHLHPGMQRKLLEVFLRNEQLSRHQYFATTHSNHFLDMAADYAGCATFLVRRSTAAPPTQFTITPIGPAERLALDELGARASSVFLTNATIWVEGVTDRLYLREYLRRYLYENGLAAALREDTHYSFMEGGGSNIAHFDFTQDSAADELATRIRAARVCSSSFVVLDGDNEGKPRLGALQKELGECIFVFNGKEVENLLPLEVLRAYVKHRTPTSDASILELKDYHEQKRALGRVLDEKLTTDIFTDGQTIKNKGGLGEFSVRFMRESDAWTLSPEAVRLCEQLLKFIRSANGIATS